MNIEEKLDKIIELLEAIKQNTQPIVSIPSVWPIYPNTDGDNFEYDGNNSWITITTPVTEDGWQQPYEIKQNNCGCKHCNPGTSSAGGCTKCGCRNIAIYTEDGHWYCVRCSPKGQS
jgi:hypothetical protein